MPVFEVRMDHDRSTANKAASGLSKTVGRMNDRTKVILVKATGEGPQKVRRLQQANTVLIQAKAGL